jgi:protein-S-isoprenylcysteine O-methyltransferase Ste14
MNNYFIWFTVACWFTFFSYWQVMSGKVKAPVYEQGKSSRIVYLFFVFSSLVSVYIPYFSLGLLGYRVIPSGNFSGIAGALICLSGLAFAIWARKTLGENWSAKITLKKEHELIQSGPYNIVRHPIYTGFELMTLGPAIVVGELKGFIALGIIFVSHLLKIRKEEELMRRQFPEQYDEYSKRVKRLVPFTF